MHLSFSADKPMDVFRGWENYIKKLEANWKRLIKDEDTVVLIGDFSWALKLEDTLADFKFLESLPGRKILIKGNHDLWWSTKTKLLQFLEANNIKSVQILFNDAYLVDGISICGTRGWFYDCKETDMKILLREAGRLETSIKCALKLGGKPVVFLHYPPVYGDYICKEIIDVLDKYNIKTVYHGHIHGAGFNKSVKEYGDIKLNLVSCDCVDFTPKPIKL